MSAKRIEKKRKQDDKNRRSLLRISKNYSSDDNNFLNWVRSVHNLGNHDECNTYSFYKDVIVLWDENRDERSFTLIDDCIHKYGKGVLIACEEHEGEVILVFKNSIPKGYVAGQYLKIRNDHLEESCMTSKSMSIEFADCPYDDSSECSSCANHCYIETFDSWKIKASFII